MTDLPSKTQTTVYRLWVKNESGDKHALFDFASPSEAMEAAANYGNILLRRVYGVQEVKTTIRAAKIEWSDDVHEPKNGNTIPESR